MLDKEDHIGIVKDFTQSVLLRSGSTGGNKNLFVSSNSAFMPAPQASIPDGSKTNARDSKASKTGFFAGLDMNATDYKSLKKNQFASRVLNNRSSSLSQTRIDREFSPRGRKGAKNDETAGNQTE